MKKVGRPRRPILPRASTSLSSVSILIRTSTALSDKDIENSKVTLIDQWRLTTCTIEFIDEKFFIRVNGEAIALNELTMIWWRIKPYFGDHPIEFVDALQARYWRQQWEAMQRSLEVLASRCYVLNPLKARQYATLKPVQLSVAKQVGLKFPIQCSGMTSGEF